MSSRFPLRRRLLMSVLTPGVAAALVAGGTPLVTAPASAVPTLPSLGCAETVAAPVSNLTDVAIPDLGILPAVSTINLPADGIISWLRVRTDIAHTNPGDLLVTLTSPLGDVLTLTSGNGGANDNVFDGTWWDDDAGETVAPGSAAEASYANNVVQSLLAPEEALANLRGQAITGQWTLTVLDQLPNLSTGTVEGWAIEYATRDGGAPNVVTSSSGVLPGAVVPAGATQTFTYPVTDAMPGSVEDVAADLDVSGDAKDVLATLTSPGGTVVTLTNGNGGLVDSFLGGTTFADVGGLVAGPVSDLLSTLLGRVALVAPQEPLSGLLGEATSGNWVLELKNLGGVPLTLNGWGLDLTSSSCGLDGLLTQVTSVPNSLPVGTTFTYAVQAVNTRLAPITGGALGIQLPAGLELVSVISTLGSCTGLDCLLGTLAPGATATVVYVLKAVTEGVKTVTVTLNHLVTDSSPLDNIVSFVTNVTQAAPGGSGGGNGAGGSTAPDTTAPSLMMLLGKDRLAKVSKKGVLAALAWTEAGRMTLKVKLPGKVAKRLKLPTLVGKRTVVTTKAGTTKIRLKLTKKAAKKLTKSTKPVRIVVKGQLRDATGNTGKSSAGATFRR